MAQTVIAVFNGRDDAIAGVQQLRREGFAPRQISILASDPREVEGYSEELGVRVVQAGSVGIAAGGLLGGLGGWITGATGLLVPGAGLVLAAGPLVGAILGAIGGASLGGFVGILVGLGLPRHAAEEYVRELHEGRTLVIVHTDGEYALAEYALGKAHPMGLHRYEERIGGRLDETERPGPGARPASATQGMPTERVEPAAPDRAQNPNDVAVAIEGQEVIGHTQYLDEAELYPISGRKDT